MVLPDLVLNDYPQSMQLAQGFDLVLNVLNDVVFSAVKQSALQKSGIRTAFLGRKGAAVPSDELANSMIEDLYTHPAFIALVQRISKCRNPLRPLPAKHKHRCSLLMYEKQGDAIPYHYDRNHYLGETYTVLLTLLNDDRSLILHSSNRTCLWANQREVCIQTPPNSLVLLHGESVLHKATPLQSGERRVVVSMVYSTNPSQSVLQRVRQSVQDWSWGF